MLMINVIRDYAASQPEAIATVFEGRKWTYRELFEKAQRIGAYLQGKGYEKDDIIALYTLNSDLFLAAYYGVQMAGLVVMPINTKLAPPEVEFIFNHSEAKALIFDEKIEETIRQSAYVFDEKIGLNKIKEVLEDDRLIYKNINIQADDTSVVMYTSGTTGKPKGVMLTHRNVYETGDIWSQSMNLTKEDRTYICTPLFHCAGLHVFVVSTHFAGGAMLISEAFSPDETLRDLQELEATIFFGVPAMYTILLNKPELKNYSFPKLRLFCYGAAPMPYELVKRLKEVFPQVKVQNLYGQTENSPAATSLLDDAALVKIGSVGKPLARTEVQVVDAEGNPLPAGIVGEICVKGLQVMKGYLRNPEETALTIRNGWLYSGDLGRFDKEGYLFIVDRKKDMIIRGGENIYPIEVEEVLYQVPEILEAAVIGLPHEVYGEVPKAFVVLKEGKEISEEQILDYCKTQLAKYKVPFEVEFIDELPRNASGKVLKHTLRPATTTV